MVTLRKSLQQKFEKEGLKYLSSGKSEEDNKLLEMCKSFTSAKSQQLGKEPKKLNPWFEYEIEIPKVEQTEDMSKIDTFKYKTNKTKLEEEDVRKMLKNGNDLNISKLNYKRYLLPNEKGQLYFKYIESYGSCWKTIDQQEAKTRIPIPNTTITTAAEHKHNANNNSEYLYMTDYQDPTKTYIYDPILPPIFYADAVTHVYKYFNDDLLTQSYDMVCKKLVHFISNETLYDDKDWIADVLLPATFTKTNFDSIVIKSAQMTHDDKLRKCIVLSLILHEVRKNCVYESFGIKNEKVCKLFNKYKHSVQWVQKVLKDDKHEKLKNNKNFKVFLKISFQTAYRKLNETKDIFNMSEELESHIEKMVQDYDLQTWNSGMETFIRRGLQIMNSKNSDTNHIKSIEIFNAQDDDVLIDLALFDSQEEGEMVTKDDAVGGSKHCYKPKKYGQWVLVSNDPFYYINFTFWGIDVCEVSMTIQDLVWLFICEEKSPRKDIYSNPLRNKCGKQKNILQDILEDEDSDAQVNPLKTVITDSEDTFYLSCHVDYLNYIMYHVTREKTSYLRVLRIVYVLRLHTADTFLVLTPDGNEEEVHHENLEHLETALYVDNIRFEALDVLLAYQKHSIVFLIGKNVWYQNKSYKLEYVELVKLDRHQKVVTLKDAEARNLISVKIKKHNVTEYKLLFDNMCKEYIFGITNVNDEYRKTEIIKNILKTYYYKDWVENITVIFNKYFSKRDISQNIKNIEAAKKAFQLQNIPLHYSITTTITNDTAFSYFAPPSVYSFDWKMARFISFGKPNVKYTTGQDVVVNITPRIRLDLDKLNEEIHDELELVVVSIDTDLETSVLVKTKVSKFPMKISKSQIRGVSLNKSLINKGNEIINSEYIRNRKKMKKDIKYLFTNANKNDANKVMTEYLEKNIILKPSSLCPTEEEFIICMKTYVDNTYDVPQSKQNEVLNAKLRMPTPNYEGEQTFDMFLKFYCIETNISNNKCDVWKEIGNWQLTTTNDGTCFFHEKTKLEEIFKKQIKDNNVELYKIEKKLSKNDTESIEKKIVTVDKDGAVYLDTSHIFELQITNDMNDHHLFEKIQKSIKCDEKSIKKDGRKINITYNATTPNEELDVIQRNLTNLFHTAVFKQTLRQEIGKKSNDFFIDDKNKRKGKFFGKTLWFFPQYDNLEQHFLNVTETMRAFTDINYDESLGKYVLTYDLLLISNDSSNKIIRKHQFGTVESNLKPYQDYLKMEHLKHYTISIQCSNGCSKENVNLVIDRLKQHRHIVNWYVDFEEEEEEQEVIRVSLWVESKKSDDSEEESSDPVDDLEKDLKNVLTKRARIKKVYITIKNEDRRLSSYDLNAYKYFDNTSTEAKVSKYILLEKLQKEELEMFDAKKDSIFGRKSSVRSERMMIQTIKNFFKQVFDYDISRHPTHWNSNIIEFLCFSNHAYGKISSEGTYYMPPYIPNQGEYISVPDIIQIHDLNNGKKSYELIYDSKKVAFRELKILLASDKIAECLRNSTIKNKYYIPIDLFEGAIVETKVIIITNGESRRYFVKDQPFCRMDENSTKLQKWDELSDFEQGKLKTAKKEYDYYYNFLQERDKKKRTRVERPSDFKRRMKKFVEDLIEAAEDNISQEFVRQAIEKEFSLSDGFFERKKERDEVNATIAAALKKKEEDVLENLKKRMKKVVEEIVKTEDNEALTERQVRKIIKKKLGIPDLFDKKKELRDEVKSMLTLTKKRKRDEEEARKRKRDEEEDEASKLESLKKRVKAIVEKTVKTGDHNTLTEKMIRDKITEQLGVVFEKQRQLRSDVRAMILEEVGKKRKREEDEKRKKDE